MHKVFVEYAIKPEKRDEYLQYMRRLAQAERRLEVLEGTDQPGLFVEIWSGVTPEEYAAMKRERLEGASGSEPGPERQAAATSAGAPAPRAAGAVDAAVQSSSGPQKIHDGAARQEERYAAAGEQDQADACLPQPAWAAWVQGGTAKLHMWHFTALR